MERISLKMIGVEKIGLKWITKHRIEKDWIGLDSIRSEMIEVEQIGIKKNAYIWKDQTRLERIRLKRIGKDKMVQRIE